jgi:nucleotide-binding universal stress UspA family protein
MAAEHPRATLVPRMGKIIVGVDGSPASKAALRWAFEEAGLRRLPLTAIYAYEYPIVSTTSQALHLLETDFAAYRAAGERILDEALNEVAVNTSVQLERVVTERPPAAALIEAAGEDDLLVVGSRGHGGFAGLMLGSVSEQCARHARSPVVVVRPKSEVG